MSLNTFYQSIIKLGKNLLSSKSTKNFNYYKLNADQGNTEAQYNIANCYFFGTECEKNLS
jgi:TPR repeat protein